MKRLAIDTSKVEPSSGNSSFPNTSSGLGSKQARVSWAETLSIVAHKDDFKSLAD